jgi:hypothetical protein
MHIITDGQAVAIESALNFGFVRPLSKNGALDCLNGLIIGSVLRWAPKMASLTFYILPTCYNIGWVI